jgi:5-methylthioribose kinase
MMALEVPPGYRPHTTDTLRGWAAELPELRAALGGAPEDWTVEEVGDGNLNLVFKLRGPAGGVAVKQALPYVRLVGESWPLPLSRAHYEHLALTHETRCAPGVPPAIIRYEPDQALIVMELLEPHIIMRRGMIEGVVYPGFAATMATFCARTLFLTSDLALPADEKKALIAAFAGNTALCKITEDLIFTDPYRIAEGNRWTSPQLDGWAAAIRGDADLKVAISRLKVKFLSSAEALLHGDLHTGSVMVTETETRVIDPEFAFVGPMGFDLGAVVANLLINYFSQRGHEDGPGARDAYRAWVLESVEAFWTGFRAEFLALWREGAAGDAYRRQPVRRRRRRRAPARRAGGLYGPPLRRHAGLRRRQDDPPRPRPRAQHRPRMDRGPRTPGGVRGACARDGARPDAGPAGAWRHRQRRRGRRPPRGGPGRLARLRRRGAGPLSSPSLRRSRG